MHGDPARFAIAVGAYVGAHLRERDVYLGGVRVTAEDNVEYVPVALLDLTRSIATLDRCWPPTKEDIAAVSGLDARQVHRRCRLDESRGVARRRLLDYNETAGSAVAFLAPGVGGLVLIYQLRTNQAVHTVDTSADEIRGVLSGAFAEIKEADGRRRDSTGMPHWEMPPM
jgi:hypothetical protein